MGNWINWGQPLIYVIVTKRLSFTVTGYKMNGRNEEIIYQEICSLPFVPIVGFSIQLHYRDY